MKVNDRHWRDRRGYDSRPRPTSRRRQQSILHVSLASMILPWLRLRWFRLIIGSILLGFSPLSLASVWTGRHVFAALHGQEVWDPGKSMKQKRAKKSHFITTKRVQISQFEL